MYKSKESINVIMNSILYSSYSFTKIKKKVGNSEYLGVKFSSIFLSFLEFQKRSHHYFTLLPT